MGETPKVSRQVQYSSVLCYWAVGELGLPGTLVATKVGLTQPVVSRAVLPGEHLAKEQRWVFPQG